jgi:AraC-like DNA-binding protein
VKLDRVQALIKEGKKGKEVGYLVGYLVGYSSPGQFGRECKRRFGFVPSTT